MSAIKSTNLMASRKPYAGHTRVSLLRHTLVLLAVLFASSQSLLAQVAGLTSLAVFDLPPTARTAALGMDYLSLADSDAAVALANPSLLLPSTSHSATLNFFTLFEGSNAGSLGYVHHFSHVGTFGFGFQFVNYGRFHGYDEEETYIGDFGASDYAITLAYGLPLNDHFSVGIDLKPILSQYEEYKAFALLTDISLSYLNSSRSFAATLMARNAGAQIATFDQTVEQMPFELSAALSYKLRNAPFRLFFAATELQRWNLRYTDPLNPTSTTDPFTGETTEQSAFVGFIDNLMRHTLFGVELDIRRTFFARLGYNYRQSAEMRGFDNFNLSGFSFGAGVRTKHFDIAYSRRNYHLSQALNYFTLTYRFQ